MKEDVLVVKREKNEQFKFKVAKRAVNSYSEAAYQNTINIKDPKQLALVLNDLKTMFGAPVDKAILEMKKGKKDIFW